MISVYDVTLSITKVSLLLLEPKMEPQRFQIMYFVFVKWLKNRYIAMWFNS